MTTSIEKLGKAYDQLTFISREASEGPWMMSPDGSPWVLSPLPCNGPGCDCGGKGFVAVAWHQRPGDAVYTVSTGPGFGAQVAELLKLIAIEGSPALLERAGELADSLDEAVTDASETLVRALAAGPGEDE